MDIVIFIVAISLFIAVHEFGHLVAARLVGMKATAYFIGFGPKIWSFQRGETEYGLRALLLGGYVKILGMNALEEVDPADRDRSFHTKPLLSRIVVLTAGVFTNFALALLLLTVALAAFAVPLDALGRPALPDDAVATITGVQENSAAQAAGVQVGDRIVSLNGQRVLFSDLRDTIREHAGGQVRLGVERDGRTLELTASLPDPQSQGAAVLGVEQAPLIGRIPLSQLAREATVGQYGIVSMTTQSVVGLGRALSPQHIGVWLGQLEGGERSDGLISIVGAGQIASVFLREGQIFSVLLLMANINLVLGLLNILPLPPLDGGHVATNVVEDVIRRWRRRRNENDDWRLDPRVTAPITVAVFVFITLIGVTALFIDLTNPASQLLR